jgi:hypothetical protein
MTPIWLSSKSVFPIEDEIVIIQSRQLGGLSASSVVRRSSICQSAKVHHR